MTDSKDKKEYSWEELKDLVKSWNDNSELNNTDNQECKDGDICKDSIVEN